MSTIKANSNGSIRALPLFNWDTAQFDHGVVAATCICCEKYPNSIPSSALVELGKTDTFSAKFNIHFAGWFTEPTATLHYVPSFSISNSVCSANFSLTFPGESGYPDPSVWLATIYLTLGDSTSSVDIPIEWDDLPAEGTFEVTINFPIRLMADILDIGRYHASGLIWGYGGEPEETIDLRGYKTAALGWYYWSDDGPGKVKVRWENMHVTHSVEGSGKPILLRGTNLSMRHANAPPGTSSWVIADCWRNPEFRPQTTETWFDPVGQTRGVRVKVEGRKVQMEQIGEFSDARSFGIGIYDLQPEQVFTLNPKIFTLGPKGELAPGSVPFLIVPKDGPDWTFQGIHTEVDNEWPLGQSLLLPAPGSTEHRGSKWEISCTSWLDVVKDRLVLTQIENSRSHDPRLGWIYSPSMLRAFGYSENAWRCPISLPTDASKWDAIHLSTLNRKTISRFALEEWLPRTETNLTETDQGLYVHGGGNPLLSIQRFWEERSGWGSARYVSIVVQTTEYDTTVGMEMEDGKQWFTTIPGIGKASVTFDLIAPDTADGVDYTSTRIETRNKTGGWAWGVNENCTQILYFSSPVYLKELTLESKSTPGFGAVAEAIHKSDDRFYMHDVETDTDTYKVYSRRGVLYAPDQRIGYDAWMGLVRTGGNQPHDKVVTVLNITQMVEQMQEQNPGGLNWSYGLRPGLAGEDTKWAPFVYWPARNFFCNRVESYHLQERWKANRTGIFILKADYTVDRLVLAEGVCENFVMPKMVGGGVHGLVVNSFFKEPSPGKLVKMLTDGDEVYSDVNGAWNTPNQKIVRIPPQQIGVGYPGDPSTQGIQHGITTRVGLVED